MTAPRQAVILLGHKLIGTDSVVPLAMQLQAERPEMEFHFVLVSGVWLRSLRENYALWTAVQQLGPLTLLSDGEAGVASKLKTLWRLIRLLVQLRRRPTWLFGYSDFKPFPFSWMARATRAGGGKVLVHVKPPFPFDTALYDAHVRQLAGKDKRMRDPGDVFILYHPDQARDYAPFVDRPGVAVGTPKMFAAWRQHLAQLRQQTGLLDWQGRPIAWEGRATFLVSYPGPLQLATQHSTPRDLLFRFFRVLRSELPGALVVIKPHPLCDVDQLRDDLREWSDLDIRVTFAHPQMLAQVAGAAVFTHASTAMNDMYVEGLPVLDICDYTDDCPAEGLFPNAGCLVCRDEDAIRAAVRRFRDGADPLPRPETGALSWPQPGPLWPLLERGAP